MEPKVELSYFPYKFTPTCTVVFGKTGIWKCKGFLKFGLRKCQNRPKKIHLLSISESNENIIYSTENYD